LFTRQLAGRMEQGQPARTEALATRGAEATLGATANPL